MRLLDSDGGLVYQSHYKATPFLHIHFHSYLHLYPFPPPPSPLSTTTSTPSQEDGVDDPNFVDAFNAYSRNGTAAGQPVYVNFGQIEDFRVRY